MKTFWKALGHAVLYSVLTLVFQAIVMMGIMGVGALRGMSDQDAMQAFGNQNMLLVTILSGCLVTLILLLIFRRGGKNLGEELRLGKLASLSKMSLLKALGLAFSVSMVIMLSHYGDLRENVTLVSDSARYFNGLVPGLGFLLLILAINVVAPLSEEVALRGIVCTRLAKQFRPWIAIVISAVLFGLMHVGAGGLMLAFTASIMGAVLGLIFFRYNSLKLSILAHAVANTPDLIFFGQPALSETTRISLISACSLLALVCLWGVLKGNKLNEKPL